MTIKLPSQTQIFLWFLRKEYQLVVKYQFWKKELIRSFSNFLFFQYSKSQVNKGKNSCIFVVVAKTVASPPSQLRQESLSKHTIYSSMQHDMMNDFHILNCFFFPLKKVHIFLPRRESNSVLCLIENNSSNAFILRAELWKRIYRIAICPALCVR